MKAEDLEYKNNTPENSLELVDYLAGFITSRRLALIDKILSQRTRHITVVLEDIFHPPNASAIIRTCECLGIQDLQVIEKEKPFRPNTDVVRGSAKWIDIRRFSNSMECMANLRKRDFAIIATTPDAGNATPLDAVPLEQKLAVFLGSEETGISGEVKQLADYHISLPMYGFTESFNVSASAAIILQGLCVRLRESAIQWQLGDSEKQELRFLWIKNSIKHVERIIERYNANRDNEV